MLITLVGNTSMNETKSCAMKQKKNIILICQLMKSAALAGATHLECCPITLRLWGFDPQSRCSGTLVQACMRGNQWMLLSRINASLPL